MVFEGLLVSVLNRFLGPYLKNLDSSQLSVGVWSGEVSLKDLQLKDTALTQFDIPIRIFNGHIDKLHLKIPWKNLYTEPVIVNVKGVYIVAGPDSDNFGISFSREKILKEEREKKQRQLKAIEDARTAKAKDSQQQEKDPGFVEKLITQIIRNVQLSVEDIHIRYEDNSTVPGRCFSFGVSLDCLMIKSTDSNWTIVPAPDDSSSLIYKLLKLNCLGLYWNPNDRLIGTSEEWKDILKREISRQGKKLPSINYLLKPLSGEAKLKGTTQAGRDHPQLSLSLRLSEVSMTIEKEQYQEVIMLVDQMERLSVSQRFRKYQPNGTAKTNRERWNFAYNAVVGEVISRKLSMRWEYIKAHRELCKKYTKLYAEKLSSNSPGSPLIAKLLDIEDKLDVFNITVCRQKAEKSAAEIKKRQDEASWYNWASSWVGSGEKEKKQVMPSEEALKLEKEKLYQAIGYTEKGKAADYSKEYVAHVVNLDVLSVSLNLQSEGVSISQLSINDINCQFQNRPASKNISVSVGVNQLLMTGASLAESRPVILSSDPKKDQLLSLKYEMNPLARPVVDHSVGLSLQPVQVTYNCHTIQRVLEMFKLPPSVRLHKTSSLAAVALDQVKTQSRIGLQHAIENRKILDINVVLHSPVVLLPEAGVLDNAKRILAVDLGSLKLTSNMKPVIPDLTKASQKELDENAYDYFDVKLEGVQARLTGEDWTDTTHTILKPLQVDLQLQKSIIPDDTRLPGLKIDCNMTSGIEVGVSVQKIKDALILFQNFPFPQLSSDTDAPPAPEDYGVFDEPIALSTDAIVETADRVTEVKKTKTESSEEDEFITASEGSDTEECGEKDKKSQSSSTSVSVASPRTTTKVQVHFSLPVLSVEVTDGAKGNSLRLSLPTLSVDARVESHSNSVSLSLASIDIVHKISEERTVNVLSTVGNEKLIVIDLLQASKSGPYFSTKYNSTGLKIDLAVNTLALEASTGSISHLLLMVDDITSVMKSKSPPTPASTSKVSDTTDTASSSSSSSSVLSSSPEEKSLDVSVKCKGVKLLLTDAAGVIAEGEMGPLASDVIIKPQNGTRIKTSLSNLVLTDATSSTQVISTAADPLIDFDLQIYKAPSADNADIEVSAAVNRIQAAVMLTFVKRLLSFVESMNVKKELVESAKEATNEQAKKAIETARKARSKRIKLDITVDAPVVSLLLTSGASFMVDLGILQLSNKFEPALNHYSNVGHELLDVMSLSLKDLQVVRHFDKGSHTIVSPVALQGTIIRTLEPLNTDTPNVAIEMNIESINISFNPGDYNEVFNVLKELPTSSSSTNEESADSRNVKSLSKTGPSADSSVSESSVESPSGFKLSFKISIGSLGLSVESDLKQTEIVSIKLTSLESSVGLDHKHIIIGFLIKSLQISDPLSSSFPVILQTKNHSRALNGQATITKADKEIQKSSEAAQIAINVHIGSHTLTVLMTFINTLMGLLTELKHPAVQPKDASVAIHTPVNPTNSPHIKIEASVETQELILPSIGSDSVLVINLGTVSLSNQVIVVKGVSEEGQLPPVLNEEYLTQLTSIELYRSTRKEGVEYSDMKHVIIELVGNMSCTITRNLSSSWYHYLPSLHIKLGVPPIKLYWSPDDSVAIAALLNGVLKEKDSLENINSNENAPRLASHAIEQGGSDAAVQDVYINFKVEISADGISANLSDTKIKAAKLCIEQIRCQASITSTSLLDSSIDIGMISIIDSRDPLVNDRTLLCSSSDGNVSMISLTFKQDPQLHQRTGSLSVCNPLVTINIDYFLYLLGYLKTLYEPFLPSTPSEPSPPKSPKSESDSVTVEQYEMKLTGSIVNARLAASGDEPNHALIAQTGVSLGISLKDGSISIHSSLNDCTLYTGSPTAKTTVNKDNIILSPCTLSFTLSTMSGHNIVLYLKRVELFISPSTVRLVLSILNKIQSETSTEGEKEKRAITAPPDLLLDKPVDESKWYFKSQEHIISKMVKDSHLDGNKGELLMLDIDQISITLLQEHPKTGEVSSAFSILLGSYGNKGLHIQAQEWSGELWAEANLSLIVSYFNTSCDVWEPILEPVVDPKDDNKYSSWQVTATVEKDINSTGSPELSACIKSASALQITLSSTGINMLSGLANDYMKSAQQALAIESTDTASYEDSSKDQKKSLIIIRNYVGKEFPVQLSPIQNIEREDEQPDTDSGLHIEYMSYVTLIRQTSSNYQLRGEILPPDVIKKEQAILSVQVKGYQSFNVTVSSSGLTYHQLKPIEKADRLPVVVEVNKVYATDPTEVIIRSSLQLKNHLSVPVSVYWSKEKHDTDVSGSACILKIKEGGSSSVPLSCVNNYLYLKPDTGGVCSNGVSWQSLSENGVYLHCKSMYIHVYSLAENYSNYLSVPPGPHHVLHIHYPFVLHNYLHNKLRVSETDILSGSFVNVSHINPERETKLSIEFSMGDGVRLSGYFELSDSMENDDIKLKSEEGKSHSVHLSVIHEIRGGTRHVNLFSPYWLINKTGLTLEYSHKAHHWGSKDSGILSKGTDLVLFSSDKVSVRVKTGDGSWSDWSNNFSLDTVGSEGIVSSSTDDKVYQMGFTCKMATFSFTKVITLTPFYMIHNKTEDIITVLEYDRPVSDTITLKPKEFVPFWPQSKNGKILVDVFDEPSLTTWSSPFDYRIKGSYLLRLNSAKVSAVTVHVSVSGFANVITFLPYTTGAAPLQLINTLPVNIEYGQATQEGDSVVKVRVLPSGVSRLFVWDDLNGKKELLWRKDGTNTSFKEYKLIDDHGTINVSLSDGSEADLKKQFVGISLATAKLKGSVKRIRGGGGEGQKEMTTDDNIDYWVSFTDNLQRVLLFTPDKTVVDTALGTLSVPSLNATLSIVAIGLSLVNSNKGIEVAYIGLPQSPVLWEIEKSRKQWKPVETDVSDKLEELHGKKKKDQVIKISDDLSIEFSNEDEVYLINSGKRSKLRRNYFNGLSIKVTKSQQMTTINLRINKVQVDNQLPHARNPSIFYCYPPPPKIASAPPKPFLELSLILKNNHDIHFLQTLIQEMGLIIDLDWLVELIPLFQFLAAPKNDEELLQEQIEMTQTPLNTLVATSSASSSSINKTFFKFVHLSPIDLHLTFSLKLSDKKKEEISFFADQNFIFKYVLNFITSVVGLFAQANDAELKLGYFEIKEQALTTKALQNRIIDHYKQQFLYQLYSVVLSLEVLGNPVGFLRGFTEGTVDLFYQPFQGAVVGPEEFFEGLALGTHQFIGGTVGGVIGIGAGVTRVLGDGLAKLTFDSEYQENRPEQKSFGRGVETLGKGFYQGLTGVVTQPWKGAKKEGVLGLIKGTGKGVLGLVFKPTGGLIDFTSATLLAVQRTTQVGELNLTQLRIARYIGNDKVIRPFSLTIASGYAVFIDYNNGELYGKEEYIGHVDLNDDPLKIFIATDKQVMILKKNTFFDKWSCDWSMEMKELVDKPHLSTSTGADRAVLFPRMEHQGGVFGFGGKKAVKSNFSLNIPDETKARKIVALSLQSYNTFAIKL